MASLETNYSHISIRRTIGTKAFKRIKGVLNPNFADPRIFLTTIFSFIGNEDKKNIYTNAGVEDLKNLLINSDNFELLGPVDKGRVIGFLNAVIRIKKFHGLDEVYLGKKQHGSFREILETNVIAAFAQEQEIHGAIENSNSNEM